MQKCFEIETFQILSQDSWPIFLCLWNSEGGKGRNANFIDKNSKQVWLILDSNWNHFWLEVKSVESFQI